MYKSHPGIFNQVYKEYNERGTKLVLSEVNSAQVLKELKAARLLFTIGKVNITHSFASTLIRSDKISHE